MGYYPNIASDARAWRAKVDPQQRPRRRPAYIIISKRQQPQIYPGRSLRGLPVALITTTRKHALPWCYRVTLMVLGFFFFLFFFFSSSPTTLFFKTTRFRAGRGRAWRREGCTRSSSHRSSNNQYHFSSCVLLHV